MLRLGIIGTGWIGHSFAEACILTGRYQVTAVCSRNKERAAEFGNRYGVEYVFENPAALASCADVDIVYIASPNALHYEQCCALLAKRKHVVVEKPAFSNEKEAKSAFALAEENGVLLLEAARHIYEPNHRVVKQRIKEVGDLTGAYLSYTKYSSRYDQVLAGESPNIFAPQFSGGALMDLGVYLVYDAVDWFGVPRTAAYFCTMLPTGVDGAGAALLGYAGFTVVLTPSKISDACLPCEIRGQKGSLILDASQNIGSVELRGADGKQCQMAGTKTEHWMLDEAHSFADMVEGVEKGDSQALASYDRQRRLTLDVHALLTKLRHSAGIVFPADASSVS